MALSTETISWVIGIVGACCGAAIYLTKSLYVKKIDGLNNDLADREKKSGALERCLKEREEELEELKKAHDPTKFDFSLPHVEIGARILKEQVDEKLESLVKEVQASGGSVYIPVDSASKEAGLRFLSMYPKESFTPSLRRRIVPLDSLAGECFNTGVSKRSGQDGAPDNHYQAFDNVTNFKTRTTLNVPLKIAEKVIGVVQVINKQTSNQEFSAADEEVVRRQESVLAERVYHFISNPDNIQILGIVKTYPASNATVMFCDLTRSTSLFSELANPSSAIQCINEYIDLASEVGLKNGAAIDKYIGDSVMLTFNVSERVPFHREEALKTALEIEKRFEKLKAEWIEVDKNQSSIFASVFSRISIGSGDVYYGITGHVQKKSWTIFGAPVIASMSLCEAAPRDGNVIVFDEHINEILIDGAITETITGSKLGKAEKFIHKGYLLLNRDFGQPEV